MNDSAIPELTWKMYSTSDEDVAFMRERGMQPVRLLTNDGAVPVMGGDTRIALVDCQSSFKRGYGYKAECEQRDANARRLVASWNALRHLSVDEIEALAKEKQP